MRAVLTGQEARSAGSEVGPLRDRRFISTLRLSSVASQYYRPDCRACFDVSGRTNAVTRRPASTDFPSPVRNCDAI